MKKKKSKNPLLIIQFINRKLFLFFYFYRFILINLSRQFILFIINILQNINLFIREEITIKQKNGIKPLVEK